MRKHRAGTRAKWLKLYRDFEDLDLTVREFCAERGVNYYTFKDWQATFRKENASGAAGGATEAFREITPVMGVTTYTLTLRGGRMLSVENGFAESRLRKLIEILEAC